MKQQSQSIVQRIFASEHRLFRRAVLVVCGLASLSGCGGFPANGPKASTFNDARWQYVTAPAEDGGSDLPFVLVDVDSKVLAALGTTDDSSYFMGKFTDRRAPTNIALGVGDTIRVTIFEAGPGGLFSSTNNKDVASGANAITLPDQEVDQTGRISVPYADKNGDGGLIKVSGRRPAEVQNDIQHRLMNKALEPQVIVTLVKRTSNLYSVMGDVNSPGRFSIEQGGVRILDALSNAGGPKNTDYNTLITLQRGTTSATARLSVLLHHSENNIFVQPSDILAVKKDERYYNVLGSTRANSRVAFEAESVTVADALAKAGGLDPEIAEPASVVVLRREEAKTLAQLEVPLEGAKAGEPMPTVYRFDLNKPSGMFLAQKMQLRNNDVVYVSKHAFSDVSKLLGALRDVLLIKLIAQ